MDVDLSISLPGTLSRTFSVKPCQLKSKYLYKYKSVQVKCATTVQRLCSCFVSSVVRMSSNKYLMSIGFFAEP